MLDLAHHVTNDAFPLEHSVAAAELLEILLRTFACDPDGDELLHPIQKAEFIDALLAGACRFEWHANAAGTTPTTPAAAVSERQKLCMTTLCTVAHLVLKEEVRRCV